jgi:tryptophan synthase alpha chain
VSRLGDAFARVRERRTPGLVTYTTAGDPDVNSSGAILLALDRAGADVLEVGVPFSDPLADGPVIQRASERALAAGMNLRGALALIARLRAELRAAVVLFTYVNPVLRLGVSRFADLAKESGVDGVLVLDLPIEEAGELRDMLRARGIDMIFLVSPTTSDRRLRRAAELGSGFLYAISRLGVTGAREHVAEGARALVGRVRAVSDLPIALGFGVSTAEHVREVCEYADAAVVGSALVRVIEDTSGTRPVEARVSSFVRALVPASVARNERSSGDESMAQTF